MPTWHGFSQPGFSDTGFSVTGFLYQVFQLKVLFCIRVYTYIFFVDVSKGKCKHNTGFSETVFSETGFSVAGFSVTSFSVTGFSIDVLNAKGECQHNTGFSETCFSETGFQFSCRFFSYRRFTYRFASENPKYKNTNSHKDSGSSHQTSGQNRSKLRGDLSVRGKRSNMVSSRDGYDEKGLGWNYSYLYTG